MTNDDFRAAAERAAYVEIEEYDTDLVARPHIWRIVNAALDAYEDALIAHLPAATSPAWAVLHENGRPWLVLPTYRIARRQRKVLAKLSDTPPWRLKIARCETVQA